MKKEAKQARRYIVKGRVQGVGFRFFVEEEAKALGLRGYVRNRYDGSVEVYAVGGEAVLRQLRARLEEGPPMSRVEQVEERVAALQDYREFVIEASG